jgi:hypothetical protein
MPVSARNGRAADAALPSHLSCPVIPDALDDAEKPKDQDQHQDAAKTDIHDTLLLLVLVLKR